MHLVVLFPPHWNWWHDPQPLPEITRLNVTLKEAPQAQPAEPVPPAPALPVPALPEAPVPRPATTSAVPAEAPVFVEPEDPEAPVFVEPEAMDDVPVGMGIPEDGMIFPTRGEMRYIVYRGDQKFEVGRATLQWQINDGRYHLELHTETSGLAALLYPVTADAESVGSFGTGGMQPDAYQLIRDDRAAETVNFNWELQRIDLGEHGEQFLHPGSQDILSLQYQFAYLISLLNIAPLDIDIPPLEIAIRPRRPLEFWVANDKRYELIRFVILGEEIQELPAGLFRTLHLQSEGGNKTIDFWLAEDYRMLPVKTRFTDKNGDIYEQALSEVFIEPDAQESIEPDAQESIEADSEPPALPSERIQTPLPLR
ncbi:MAG: DUF3108 domain-containing protein [Zoogloeaceae bacterium]|nr:DUF3108 domain-containing protein [Zoogloeaceae bacterium]